jgi:hypothetical protein
MEASYTPPSGLNADTIICRDDYIEVTWDGAQNREKVRQSNLDTLAAAEILKAKGLSIRLFFCIRRHPLVANPAAFDEVLKIFRAVSFERLVLCGDPPPMVMSLATSVISSFNKELDITFIKDPARALAWLRR